MTSAAGHTARPGADAPAGAALDVVTFRLSGEVLAVPAARLREVLEPPEITRVPGAPDFVSGIINVRGVVVPLADLRVPLRMPRGRPAPEARILVIELPLAGEETVVGIHADSVHEVTRLDPDCLERIPAVGSRWPPRHVAAVGRWCDEFVTLPDLPAIFADFLATQTGQTSLPGTSGSEGDPHAQAEPESSPCD